MQETIIDFIRHGSPVGGRRYRGNRIDDPLSEQGWQQMWNAVGNASPWHRIISSPLQRCHAFATALGERNGIPVTIDERFKEVGFGSWEGKSPDELIADNRQEYDDFYADPLNSRPAGAEPLRDFGRRVSDAYESLVHDHPGEHLLVVAHAGVIRAALGHVLQATPVGWYRSRVDNAALTRFRHGRHGSKLDFHNLPRLP